MKLSKLKKYNTWYNILLFILIIYLVVSFFRTSEDNKEGFAQKQKFVVKNNDSLYDDFYSRIYDKLFMN